MAGPEDLARLRDLAVQEELIAWINGTMGEPGGDFAEGLYAGIRAAIRRLPDAIDAAMPGSLPVPFSEGCGCGPGEVCAPPSAPTTD